MRDLSSTTSPWQSLPLGEVTAKVQDGTHFSPTSKSGPFRYVTSKNVRVGQLDLGDCGWISEREHRRIYQRCDVRLGDVLLTKDGVNTGNACLNSLTEEISLLSSVAFVRADEVRLNASFALQYLISPSAQARMQDLMSGNAIRRLTLKKIKSFTLPIPPLSEQRQIAAVLDTVDEAIRKTEQIIAKLKQVKQGLLHDLLTRGIDDNGELRDPGRHPEQFKDSPLGRIPIAWEVAKFGDRVREVLLGTSKRGQDPMGDNLALLKMGNLTWGGLDLRDIEQVARAHVSDWRRLLLGPGDLLFNTRNTPELVGKTAAWREDSSRVVVDNNILRARFAEDVNGVFLAAFMGNGVGRRRVGQLATGTTSVAAVYWSSLRKFEVPIPPRPEQDEVVIRVDGLAARMAEERRQLQKLGLLKAGLMEDLLTGRVRMTSFRESAAP